jgi:DNA-binding NtrC family response regulator
VDVRVIAATNRDLAAMVRDGAFREDLYFRLNVIDILLPPLRERPDDIPGLVGRLFERVCSDAGKQEKKLCDAAYQALCSYHWPGNLRELENALRRAVALSEGTEVTRDDFPASVVGAAAGAALRVAADVIDAAALRRALAAGPPSPELASFEWPGHVDYARRAYMRALIRYHRGDLHRIAGHWNRSSENTLLKIIREFGLAEELQAARKAEG